MKYALINQMSAIHGDSIGRVVSWHLTEEAAQVADMKLQRLTRKANGEGSFLPTRIVRIAGNTRGQRHVSPFEVV